MNLIDSEDLLKAASVLEHFGGNSAAKLIMHILRLNKINKLYSDVYDRDPMCFLDRLISELNITIDYSEEELCMIPKEGAFITISNHPFGGLDGIILLWLLAKRRADYKVMVNFMLKRIEPLNNYFLGVNPFEGVKSVSSAGGVKEALRHLSEGKPLGIFPAGEVSSYKVESNMVEDKEWGVSVVRMIKKAKVPVVPIYFKGSNSFLFHLLGLIHPMLRTIKLPSELLNKKNTVVKLRIGSPIEVSTQDSFTDVNLYGKFLRAKTNLLGSSLEIHKFFKNKQKGLKREEPIAAAISSEILEKEVGSIPEHLLFRLKDYAVYCVPSFKIPNVLNEIGRLREITFRAVNEGTNHSIDLDEFDLYYNHLFIWDTSQNKIVGAYRVGKGKEIIEQYGIKGFYVNTLFRMKRPLMPMLYESLELGRSFIVKEYQRKPLPLFLLWKGLLYFLIKNPEYRYLAGPVSISGGYTEVSKELIMKFIIQNHYNEEMAKYVQPRSKYRVDLEVPEVDVMLEAAHNDIAILDKMVGDIEPTHIKLPVLLKKYIGLNAKIIGFNIDPDFNMCLDGLLVLDLFDVPMKTIESLSKEFNDITIMNRFTSETLNL